MTPESAVGRFAEIIAARSEFTENELYAAMTEEGISGPVADCTYVFTQTAWSRAFLKGLGVQFSSDFFWFGGEGDIVATGQLAEDPYFVAALRLASRYTRSPGYQRFVLMSADFKAVNDALNAGSKAEQLVMGPAAFFAEAPTGGGMHRVQQFLASRLSGGPSGSESAAPAAKKKAWWRFW